MVPGCTNNSRKTTGISYHRLPTDKRLRQAWMARVRRENPLNIDNCFVCSAHFTPDCFEEIKPSALLPGYRSRPRLKPNSIPSIFPQSKPETPRTTCRRRMQVRAEQAKREVAISIILPMNRVKPSAKIKRIDCFV